MQIDASTVEAIAALVFALTAGFLAWTWYTQRSSGALLWWSLTFAIAAASAGLTWTAAAGDGAFSLVADDYLLLLAHLFLWSGFRAFNGRRPPFGWAALVLGLYTLALVGLRLPLREFLDVAVLLAVAITLVAATEFARATEETLSWKRVAVAITVLHGAFLGARLVLASPVPRQGPVSLDHVLEVGFLVEPVLLAVALGFTMIGMVSERLGAAHEAEARRDPLTGALNRRGLSDWMARQRARAGAFADFGLAAIAADLDHFKRINDTHGHAAGDRVLAAFAETAGHELRQEDVLARIGGEEFVILLKDADEARATAVAERLRIALAAHPVTVDGTAIAVTASFGVAATSSVRRGGGLPALVAAADQALYAAKRGGRDRVERAGHSSASADSSWSLLASGA
jgi:diguanylate cyclase (GGDEF)-like protein